MLNFDTSLDWIVFFIEILGVISFASSGAIVAIRKKADIIGILILTLIEVFGGGVLRDLIINKGAPHLFWDIEYFYLAGVAIIVSFIWFFIGYFNKSASFIEKHRHDMWIYVLDAVGVAIFCVAGCKTAYKGIDPKFSTFGSYVFIIFLGVVSGVCGGIFRDICIGEIPKAFKKHFYITPAVIGTLIYAILYVNGVNELFITLACSLLIIVLRTLAIIFKWNIPAAKAYNELVQEHEGIKEIKK